MLNFRFHDQLIDPLTFESAARAALASREAVHYERGRRKGWVEAFFRLGQPKFEHLASSRPDGRIYVFLEDGTGGERRVRLT